MERQIKVTIQKEARKHKIKNAYQLQRALNLSPSVAADLWGGEKLPRLETLEKLCAAWGCEIGDLVRYAGTRRPASRNGKG